MTAQRPGTHQGSSTTAESQWCGSTPNGIRRADDPLTRPGAVDGPDRERTTAWRG